MIERILEAVEGAVGKLSFPSVGIGDNDNKPLYTLICRRISDREEVCIYVYRSAYPENIDVRYYIGRRLEHGKITLPR